MSIADLIRRMTAAGAPGEAIALAVEAIEAAQARDDDRKAKQRERTRQCRERQRYVNVTVTSEERDSNSTAPLPPSSPLPSPAPLPTPLNPPTPRLVEGVGGASIWPKGWFDGFYQRYPRKQGRQDAEKAAKAVERMAGVTPAIVRAGLDRLIGSDPDPQFIPLPATWLRGRRWEDEPPANRPRPARAPPALKKGPATIFDEAFTESRRDADHHPTDLYPAEPLRPESRRSGGPVLEQDRNGSWLDARDDFRQARAFGR